VGSDNVTIPAPEIGSGVEPKKLPAPLLIV